MLDLCKHNGQNVYTGDQAPPNKGDKVDITINLHSRTTTGGVSVWQYKLPKEMTMQEARKLQDSMQKMLVTRDEALDYAERMRVKNLALIEKMQEMRDIVMGSN